MVESAVSLRSYVNTTPDLVADLKLPRIQCGAKILELHKDSRISLTMEKDTRWKKEKESLNGFLSRFFTNIQKIEILKKIFHGLHTNEREFALAYLDLLK